jgi:UTP--glucose-1-phosphate uridylyltransferase
MLTIVDRPLIQYAIDEAREAGIEQMIFVTGRGKAASTIISTSPSSSRRQCATSGKSLDPLAPSRSGFGEIVSVRQQQPLGLGHAVWCARDIVGDEPFAVLLPDELMLGKPNCLAQMVEAYEKVGGNVVAALEVPASETHKYGVIDPGDAATGG